MPKPKRQLKYESIKSKAFDFEKVLKENCVIVFQSKSNWVFTWSHGKVLIGDTTTAIAKKAAAIFVTMWNLGFSIDMSSELMRGYVLYLEKIDAR
jgi:hypothetical protein